MKKGLFLTLMGGICWGFSGACGQFLFQHHQINSYWLASIRMCGAGIILFVLSYLFNRNELKELLSSKKDLLECLIFGIAGLAFCQTTYLQAIKYSNAGTATVLQYTYPVMIMLLYCLTHQSLPTPLEAVCVALVISGTFIIATHGNPTNLAISQEGLTWGLISAVSCCFYTLLPRRLMKVYGSLVVTGLGMLFGSVFMLIAFQTPTLYQPLDVGGWMAIGAIIVVGTALAYTMYLSGVNEIGPVQASMIASIEPVSAACFAFFWLHTSFQLIDLLGFAMILLTIFLLAIRGEET